MARPALLALLLALTASTPAQAAVVRADVVVEERGADSMTVRVEAAPGERNAMTVTRDAGGTFQVQDVGAPLTAGPGASPSTPTTRPARRRR